MPTRSIRRLLIITVGTGLVACSDAPTASDSPPPANGASALSSGAFDRTDARFEVPYMEYTIDHHAMGVMMASLCLDKAFHAELLELCQRSLENQQEEIALLQSWLEEWYGVSYEPRMQPGDERMMEKLAALSPEEFEMEFLEMFSRHHWIIIHRSISVARDAIHEPLEEMARNIVTNQYADVERMRTWLCEWYGKCLPVPPLPPID